MGTFQEARARGYPLQHDPSFLICSGNLSFTFKIINILGAKSFCIESGLHNRMNTPINICMSPLFKQSRCHEPHTAFPFRLL